MFSSIKESKQNIVNSSIVSDQSCNSIINEHDRINYEARRLVKRYLDNGFAIDSIYTYRLIDGSPLFWRLRLKNTSGEKKIFPMRKSGDFFEMREPNFSGKKPLYHHERIKPSIDRVWVVEGENKVRALEYHGICAVTSGGATSAQGFDWTALEGRAVTIWPDNDTPGKSYAKNVADILCQLGCEVSFIDIDHLNLNESDDVINWLKNNQSASKNDIEELPCHHHQSSYVAESINKPITQDSIEWKEPLPLSKPQISSPYPIDALPDSIKRAVQEVVGFVQCPIAIGACSALANIALASQGLVNVMRTEGLEGPISLYCLVVAESGERKSTVDNKFSSAIREWQKENGEIFRQDFTKYEAAMVGWNAIDEALNAAIKFAAKKGECIDVDKEKLELHLLQKPPKPTLPRLLYTDATTEAMAYDLVHKYPYAGIFSSEAGSVLGGAGMNSDAIMKSLAFLNILWEGGEHPVSRRTSESFVVKDARLSIFLAIQADTLRAFFTNSGKLARGTGFLARFLMAIPVSTQGTRMFQEAPKDWPALKSFHERIRNLLDCMNKDEPPKYALCMSSMAKNQWIDFHNNVESKLAEDGEMSEIKDVASKAADNVARLAALFHVFENGPSGDISEDHVLRASAIVFWHLNEARRFLTDIALPQAAYNTIRLHQWLVNYCLEHKVNFIEHSKVRQSGPNQLRNKEGMDKALDELKSAYLIEIFVIDGKKQIHLNPISLADGRIHYSTS